MVSLIMVNNNNLSEIFKFLTIFPKIRPQKKMLNSTNSLAI